MGESSKGKVNKYDYIIVGAGLSGLTTAAILTKKRKKVLVIEQAEVPGGSLRNLEVESRGYTHHFDSSLVNLKGFTDSGEFAKSLKKAGVYRKVKFTKAKSKYIIRNSEGEKYIVANDFQAYKNTLIEKFPDYSDGINSLFKYIKSVAIEIEKGKIPRCINLVDQSAYDFIQSFVDEQKFVELFTSNWMQVALTPQHISAYQWLYEMAPLIYYGSFYIKGGSQHLIKSLVAEIKKHKGEFLLNTEVKEIDFNAGKAKFVRTRNDTEHQAKKFIFCNSLPHFADIFYGFPPKKFKPFEEDVKEQPSGCSLTKAFIGLKCDPSEIGIKKTDYIFQEIRSDYAYNNMMGDRFNKSAYYIANMNIRDSDLYPKEQGAISVTMVDHYRNWRQGEGYEYARRKEEYGKFVIRYLEKQFPGIKNYITSVNVIDPHILHNQTLNSFGAVRGFQNSVYPGGYKNNSIVTPIKNVYVNSSWTTNGGGIHGAIIGSNNSIREMNKKFKYKKREENTGSKMGLKLFFIQMLLFVFLMSNSGFLGNINNGIKAAIFTISTLALTILKPGKGISLFEKITILFGLFLTSSYYIDYDTLLSKLNYSQNFVDANINLLTASVLSIGMIMGLRKVPTIGYYMKAEFKQDIKYTRPFLKISGRMTSMFAIISLLITSFYILLLNGNFTVPQIFINYDYIFLLLLLVIIPAGIVIKIKPNPKEPKILDFSEEIEEEELKGRKVTKGVSKLYDTDKDEFVNVSYGGVEIRESSLLVEETDKEKEKKEKKEKKKKKKPEKNVNIEEDNINEKKIEEEKTVKKEEVVLTKADVVKPKKPNNKYKKPEKLLDNDLLEEVSTNNNDDNEEYINPNRYKTSFDIEKENMSEEELKMKNGFAITKDTKESYQDKFFKGVMQDKIRDEEYSKALRQAKNNVEAEDLEKFIDDLVDLDPAHPLEKRIATQTVKSDNIKVNKNYSDNPEFELDGDLEFDIEIDERLKDDE